MSSIVDQWLEFEDYDEGVELYSRYADPPGLLSFFRLGENSGTRSMLRKALLSLNIESADPVDESPSEKETTPKDDLRQLYAERALVHASLQHQTSDSDRFKLAKRIVALTDRIERIHRPLPQKEELTDNPVRLQRQLTNNRAYISKNKDRESKKQEVSRRQVENSLIEEKLGQLAAET